MNHRKHRIPALIVLVAVLAFTACASTNPPGRNAMNFLESMKVTADSAMRVCATAYAAGQITEQQKAEAIASYDAFAAAEITAATTLSGAKTQADVDAIVANVSKTLTKLLELLRAFGVKGV